jgi:hypothetical protein
MPDARPVSSAHRVRWYYVFIPAAALLLPALLWRLADQPYAIRREGTSWGRDTGQYAGADACRSCHGEIVEQQLATSHALTVRDLSKTAPLAPFDTGQPVIDPLTGAQYTMEKGRGRPRIVLTMGSQRAEQELAFEFGSGVHATGYLARVGTGSWIDARLNHYNAIQAWDFTSSQDKPNAYLTEQPLGRPQTEALAAQCFACHSTVVRVRGKGTEPDGRHVRLSPEHSILGVTCESCHGPRAEHVRAWKAGKGVASPARLSADEINQMCGQCHGLTNVNPSHPVISRFQPWGLNQSRCFLASGGRLSCLTCHDPHGDAVRGADFYEQKCLSCHSAKSEVAKTICPVNPRTGCVKCHMPEDSKSMLHMRFFDHRIRVVPKGPTSGSRAALALRSLPFASGARPSILTRPPLASPSLSP